MDAFERKLTFTIKDEKGMHMRPAAQLVSAASQIQHGGVKLSMQARDEKVNPTSMLGVVRLALKYGEQLTLILQSPEPMPDDTIQDILSRISSAVPAIVPAE